MHENDAPTDDEAGQQPYAWDQTSYEDRRFEQLASQDSELTGIEFYQCTFDRCQFLRTQFRGCRFEECVFEKCDLSLMKVVNCSFVGVKFLKDKMLGIDWTKAKTLRFAFHGSDITHSTFAELRLPAVEMIGCRAREVDFSGASLTKGILTQTDFLDARFVNTDLSYADFSNAKNYSINPTQNRLKKTVFTMPEAVALLNAFDIVLG